METHQVGEITSWAGWVGSIRSLRCTELAIARKEVSRQYKERWSYWDKTRWRQIQWRTTVSPGRSQWVHDPVKKDHVKNMEALEVNYACTVEPQPTILDVAVLINVFSSLLVMLSSDSYPSTLPRRQKHDPKKFWFVRLQSKHLEVYNVSNVYLAPSSNFENVNPDAVPSLKPKMKFSFRT